MHQQTTISTGDRFTAPTPKFFRFIRNAGAVIGAIGAGLAYYQHNGEALPPLLDYINGAAVAIGGAIGALVAQFTVDYPAYAKQHELDAVGQTR